MVADALAAGGTDLTTRQRLAAQAFAHTASYDVAVASWFGNVLVDISGGDGFPAWAGGTWTKRGALRYGENSHQPAALYASADGPAGITQAVQLHGKEMSYNNYTDGDAAYRAAYDFDEPAVAIIKHANPCGIAVGSDVAQAHRKAHACDPVSAFGGVIATNRPVSVAMAQQVAEVFTEVVIAPDYEEGAFEVLAGKKNIRILRAGPYSAPEVQLNTISGGALLKVPRPNRRPRRRSGELATGQRRCRRPATLADLVFAWRACCSVVEVERDPAGRRRGLGRSRHGQVNRVDPCRWRAGGDRAAGSVAASDAFFPFSDGPQILLDAGVRAIVQPGGSVRDDQTIGACRAAGVTMYFTGNRHFFH